MENILINIGMYLTYALVAVAILALLFFSIKQFVEHIGKSKTTLIGLGALVVIFLISYLISSPVDLSEAVFEKVGTSYGSSKVIGAGIIACYFLVGITILSLIVSEVSKAFKK